MKLGEKLKKYRKERKLSQREVAEKLNVTRQVVSYWECDLTIPDIQILQQLAELYEIDMEEMLQEENSTTQNEEIAALICEIILAVAFKIPVVNIIVSLIVLWKYKTENIHFSLGQ